MAGPELFDNPITARYCVGIDLGTTNCAVAYVDTQANVRRLTQYLVPQLVDLGTIERRTTLPSFLYQFSEESSASTVGQKSAEGMRYCVGYGARSLGSVTANRLIESAKSWLCHGGIDRTAKILPWHAASDVMQLSPVDACSKYLLHLRESWDADFPDSPLAQQDVVITLPASFDEVARELTIQAAKLAGLERILLIEEPQAAFYSWLADREATWSDQIRPGQTILVCDIGGGTTDFTLIRVRGIHAAAEESSAEQETPKGIQSYGLHRVAVGEHLLLGGDNLDAAIAAEIERSQEAQGSQEFSAEVWQSVRGKCRQAKEALLNDNAEDQYQIYVAGKGRSLVKQGSQFVVSKQTVEEVVLDGFLPIVDLKSWPIQTESGFREFGLPYAKDPAITKHLAKFLWQHRFDGREATDEKRNSDLLAARPDWILFNGGVTTSSLIRNRIVDQIERWFGGEHEAYRCQILESQSLDLAVSRGAAYFALVRRNEGLEIAEGVRIDARLARSYFLMIQTLPPLVMCVMAASSQTLQHHVFESQPFEVQIGRPVQFPLYYSSTRLNEAAGEIVALDLEAMLPLPLLQTVLQGTRRGRAASVSAVLESQLSEIGTLQLYLQQQANSASEISDSNSAQRWKLEFDLRSTVETERVAHVAIAEQEGFLPVDLIRRASDVIREAFSPNAGPIPSSKNLFRRLVEVIDLPRDQWPVSLLRELWQVVNEVPAGERSSVEAESRWLNLQGYFLRPGFGFSADDWRVGHTWRSVGGKLRHFGNVSEAIILWRRVSGGFAAGQQQALLQEHTTQLNRILAGNISGVTLGYASELIRLGGSLEHLPLATKRTLMSSMVAALGNAKLVKLEDAVLWAVGRIGARQPVYGPLNLVLQPDIIIPVLDRLRKLDASRPSVRLAIVQLSRMTGDRYRDIPTTIRATLVEHLKKHQASQRQIEQIQTVTEMDSIESSEIMGDSIPLGLQLQRIS